MSYSKLSDKAKALIRYSCVRGAMDKLKNSEKYEERACLDDYDVHSDCMSGVIAELNMYYKDLNFKLEEVMGGFGTDLVITDKQRKAEYDKIPKTHTRAEVEEYLAKNYGISRICCGGSRSERLTEDEFQKQIKAGKLMQDMFHEAFKKKG